MDEICKEVQLFHRRKVKLVDGFDKNNYAIVMVAIGVGLIGIFLIGRPGFLGTAGICMFLTALVLTVINFLDIRKRR